MGKISQPVRIFFLFLFLFAFSTKRSVSSWNDASRMAAIQALVEQRKLAIDGTLFEGITADKYQFQGQTFSSKPPALALWGAAVYAPLYVLGITFNDDPAVSYYLITLLTVGILSALGLTFFWKVLVEFFGASRQWANLVTVIAGAGTLILPYSLVFNSHVVCGSLMLLGFYAALKHQVDKAIAYVVLAGFLFSLAGSIDTSCLIFLPFVFLIFLRRSFKSGVVFAAACLPLLLSYFGMNLLTSGSLLPPTLNAPLRSASSSTFTGENLSGLASHETLQQALTYTYHVLIGKRGLLSHTPILILSILGISFFFRERKVERFFNEYLLILVACAAYVLLTILRTNNYSGNAFGIRWFASLMLLLMLSLVFLEDSIRASKTLRQVFWLVSALSIAIAVVGSYRPFLPSVRPVVGDPNIVENTIRVAIDRLVSLATIEGRIRTLLLLMLALVIFASLARNFTTESHERA